MIDSSATRNFMSRKFAINHRIPGLPKERPYQLTVVNGKPLNQDEGMVKEETLPLMSQIHGKDLGCITFDLVSIPHEVILGIPWLEKVNPSIDWNSQKITIGKEKSKKSTPKQGKTLMIEICKLSQKQIRKIQQQEPQRVLTVWIKPVLGQLNATQEEDEAQAKIPRDYQEFYTMFKEEAHEKLPEHQDWDHEIPIEKEKKPTYGPIYALSETELKTLREYLDKNLKKRFIRPSTSLARYSILFVPKKDRKLRLCVDYRQLNAITVKNKYPLPLISGLQDRIQGSQWFIALNIRGAFNLVRMREGEEWKTAFQTRYGHYKYTVMPFGLTNAPATFQALINTTLCKYLDIFVTAYLDNILIYTKGTLKEHIQEVKKVFKALQEANIRLQPDKCKFHVKTVKFLGSIITTDGIQMDKKKVKAIRKWPDQEI